MTHSVTAGGHSTSLPASQTVTNKNGRVAMNLCLNCLQGDAAPVDVGPEEGSQRDPYRRTVALCPACTDALTSGRLDVLHERYSSERTVRREG